MAKNMEEESTIIKVEPSMMANGTKIGKMDLAFILTPMPKSTKETG